MSRSELREFHIISWRSMGLCTTIINSFPGYNNKQVYILFLEKLNILISGLAANFKTKLEVTQTCM
jgi:hypothetical protein